MHQAAGDAVSGASAPKLSGLSWREIWPWLVAFIPWALLVNYLRLEWSVNEQYSYGFVVPILSFYLVVQLWPMRPDPRPTGRSFWLSALTVFFAALFLPLLLLVEASPEWRLIGWLLALATLGLTTSLLLQRAGWPWLRHFAFPLLFILAAVPWPTSLELKLMTPLMQWDAASAVEILNWCGIPAVQHQNIIQLPNGFVGVDEACSGIRSLQTSLMIALFVGEWMQLRLARRALLLVAALVITYGFNLLRTLILVSLSANWGSASLHRWHDTVGLIILALSLVALWILAIAIREKNPTAPTPKNRNVALPAPWPRGRLAVLGIWLVLAIMGTQLWFDWHEAKAPPPIRWNVDWPKNLSTYETVEIPVEARTSFKYDTDASSAAKWQSLDSPTLWLGYFLRWAPGRETSILASTHHPDVCLPATGKSMVANYGVSLFSAAGLSIPAQLYQFDDGGQPLYVFYCTWIDGHAAEADSSPAAETPPWITSLRKTFLPFTPAGEFDYRLRAIAEGRRNEGQQVLELGLWGASSKEEAKKEFAGELTQLVRRLP